MRHAPSLREEKLSANKGDMKRLWNASTERSRLSKKQRQYLQTRSEKPMSLRRCRSWKTGLMSPMAEKDTARAEQPWRRQRFWTRRGMRREVPENMVRLPRYSKPYLEKPL